MSDNQTQPHRKNTYMSKKYKFHVTVSCRVEVEFNASIMPDDDWRKQFYPSIRRPQDLAEHFAYNAVANGITNLSQLDGFADRNDRLMKITECGSWEV